MELALLGLVLRAGVGIPVLSCLRRVPLEGCVVDLDRNMAEAARLIERDLDLPDFLFISAASGPSVGKSGGGHRGDGDGEVP